MCCEWLNLSYWEAIGQPQLWGTIVGRLITGIVALVSVLIASYMTYRYVLRNNKTSHNTEVKVDRLKREIEALENTWSLLAYMSDKKSNYAILHWTKDSRVPEDKQYFVHFKNLEYFCLKAVNEVFYQRHAGLFLPNTIRDQLFAYRNKVGTLYFWHKDDDTIPEDGLILIKKQSHATELIAMYSQLNTSLKAELDKRYEHMSV